MQLIKAIPYGINALVSAGLTWSFTKIGEDYVATQTERTCVSDLERNFSHAGIPLPDMLNNTCRDWGWPNVACDTSLNRFADWGVLDFAQINETLSTLSQQVVNDEFNHTGPAVGMFLGSIAFGIFATTVWWFSTAGLKEARETQPTAWSRVTHLVTTTLSCVSSYGMTALWGNPNAPQTIENTADNIVSQLYNQTVRLPMLLKEMCPKWQGTIVICNVTEMGNMTLFNDTAISKIVNGTAQPLIALLSDPEPGQTMAIVGTVLLGAGMLGGTCWLLCCMRKNGGTETASFWRKNTWIEISTTTVQSPAQTTGRTETASLWRKNTWIESSTKIDQSAAQTTNENESGQTI